MSAPTSDRLIKAINRTKAECRTAERRGVVEDVAVLDEEREELRLTLLKLCWKELKHARP
jgi:hypothetical protein